MEVNSLPKRIGLYSIFFRRLEEAQKECRRELIRFPVVFEKLCRNFSITKQECWEILFLLRDAEWIEIIAGHGVRIRHLEIDPSIFS